MESTSGFTGSEPNKSENEKGDKKEKRSYSVSRPDLALRFSYQQREVPSPQREAMGRALLDGVVFVRPAGERAEKSESKSDKKEKQAAKPTFEDIMREGGFGKEFEAATTKEGERPKTDPGTEMLKREAEAADTDVSEDTIEDASTATVAHQPEAFEDILKRAELPPDLTEFASDDQDHPAKPTPHIPSSSDVPQGHPSVETPLTAAEQNTFAHIAHEADMDDIAEHAALKEIMETPVPAMHVGEHMSDDDSFRDIIRHEGAADPGPARHIDAVPGMPFMVGGGVGEGGGPPRRYENAGFDTPEEPEEPQAFRNARALAGNVLRPGGLAGIGALEAQRRIDSLRHRAAEMGLAGGITVLGLLLVAEHVTAKRRDKKQQKQINTLRKDVKTQGQQLQQEQLAHQQTRANLSQSITEQKATAEKLQEAMQPTAQEFAPAAAAAFAGAELTQQRRAETPLQTTGPHAQPGAERFAPRPTGVKPEQMPAAEAMAAEQATEIAGDEPPLREGERRVRESWYDAVVDREGRVVEDAIAYGQGMRQERRSEQLRDRTADTPQQPSGATTGNATQSQGAAVSTGSVATDSMYRLPTYNSPELLSGITTASLPPGHPAREDTQHLLMPPKQRSATAILKKPWLWVFAGLLLLAFFVASLAG